MNNTQLNMKLSKNALDNNTLSNEALGVYAMLAMGMELCDHRVDDAVKFAVKFNDGNDLWESIFQDGLEELDFSEYLDDIREDNYLDENGYTLFISDMTNVILNSGMYPNDVSPAYDLGRVIRNWIIED